MRVMGKYLDLDDVAATSGLAAQELAELRAENSILREEVMHLRMYAPGQRQEHKIRMAPQIAPTNAKITGG